MPTTKTTGVILRRTNLGEADRIITIMTPDQGKVRAVARGVRKIKSRMAGHLELFSRTELMLASGRNLDIITSAKLEHYPATILADYHRLAHAYLVAELIDKLTADRQPVPGVYDLACRYYQQLDEAATDELSELAFKLRLLEQLGYAPQLEACAVCGRPAEMNGSYWFSVELGGIVDESCAGANSFALSHAEIKLWRLALASPLRSLSAVQGAIEAAKHSLSVLDRFYDYLFSKRFKSQSILRYERPTE